MDSGEQYVIMDLILMMHLFSVNNWDIQTIQIIIIFLCMLSTIGYTGIYYICYRSGSSSQHIWMSNLACSSSFSCLGSCQSCPTNSYQECSHSEDVTIQCSKLEINKLLNLSTLPKHSITVHFHVLMRSHYICR